MGLFSRTQPTTVTTSYSNSRFTEFKKYLHLYIVAGDKCLVKFHSFDAEENKSLYDAPIIREIPKEKDYYEVFKSVYAQATGVEYKEEKAHQGARDVVEPKVILDTKNKKLIYIMFVKNCDRVNTATIPSGKFIYDYINVNDLLNTIYSTKFVNYGDAYREFVVFSISQLFNIGDYIKTLKYTSNQEN